ncbi:hypothetical protein P261_01209 [Lachnospiraceae bacterium TWA4]|nr:hypothetical protein P261_01209 [Lachnospiraceae bacterium TWA4]
MLDFEEELKKFTPSKENDKDVEEKEPTDYMDIILELTKEK